MNFTPTELGASIIFSIAVLHTFCTSYFEVLASKSPRHSGLWHLLGEVEIVFGFWAAVLTLYICFTASLSTAKEFLNTRNYSEALFVFAIMIVWRYFTASCVNADSIMARASSTYPVEIASITTKAGSSVS